MPVLFVTCFLRLQERTLYHRIFGLTAFLVVIGGLPFPSAWAQIPSSPASGAEEPLTIVITTSRTPIPSEEALADLTVIDEKTIANSGAASLPDLLARQPGIEIVRYGGHGAASSLFLRGSNSGHTLVLIDGVRTASLSTGMSSLEILPLANIERIEILRGAASMLFGADALGGVVQIFTKSASSKPLSLMADTACGAHRTCMGNASISGTRGLFRWAVGAGAEYSRGFNVITNPNNFSYNPDRDGYRNNHQHASLEFVPNDDHRITLAYLRDAMDAQIDVSPFDDDRTQTQFSQTRLAGSHRLSSVWQTRWQLSEMRNDSRTLSFGDVYRYRSHDRQYLWQNEFDLTSWITGSMLLFALERDEQRLDSTTDYDINTRNTDSVTGSYRWRYDNHSMQLSGRYDHSSQYGGETNGGISYGYRIAPSWQLTAGIATAFKAPTFNDLYFPGYSNPDLAPEKGRTIEAGLQHTIEKGALRGKWRATVWDNRVRDLIVYTCHNTGLCRPENIDRAQLRGITLAADFDYHGFGIAGSIDRQSAKNGETGFRLPRRAQTHGSITVSKTTGAFYGAVNLVASGRRYDNAANTVRLGGHGVVNLVAEWSPPLANAGKLTWFARFNNVFNKDYQLAADFATGGAQLMIGVRGQW
ncbi:MAG: TonB-dependent receptor [Burkholderiales bacterium]|jgi:vitamin B12 transporter|nr:TonB-dependent receptor [Burkholderiales bacterium]